MTTLLNVVSISFFSLFVDNNVERYRVFDCRLTFLFLSPTEKLYNSTGRELRRALFSLKQIFQVIIYLY